MRELIYRVINLITAAHTYILSLNDKNELFLDDKQLHFLVIGALGMLLVLLIHPLFLSLSKSGHTMVITWLYVFTVILVLTFAIEIGQGYSGNGNMEAADIVSGIQGFLLMFFVFIVIRGIIHGIISLFKRK